MNAEKFMGALKKANQYLADHKDSLEQLAVGAKSVYDAVVKLAKKKKVDVSEVLSGDPVADRAIVEAAGVQASSPDFDWNAVLELVYILVDIGGTFIGFPKK